VTVPADRPVPVGAGDGRGPARPAADPAPERAFGHRRPAWPARRWAMLVVVLVFASDFEFRRRSSTEALSGSVDAAIAVELACYLGVGVLLFLVVARPPRAAGRPLPSPLTAMWALVGMLGVSSLWAPTPMLGLARTMQLVVVAALVTSIARHGPPGVFHVVAHAYTALVSLGVALGVVFRRPPELQLSGRFLWLYGHPVVSGSLLAVSVTLLAAWLVDPALPRSFPRRAYAPLLAVHGLALLATETRGSVLAAVAGLAVLGWLASSPGRRLDLTLLSMVGVPAALGLAWPLLRSFALRGESAEQLRGLNSRAELWTEAMRALSSNPLFGRGYFSSRQIFLDSIGLGGAHNAYLEVAISAGLAGTILLAVLLVQLAHQLVRAGRHPDRPVVAAVTVTLLVNGFTAQYFSQSGTGANVLFLLVCAWAATLRRRDRSRPQPG